MSTEDRDDKDPLQSLIAEILEAENRGEIVDRNSLLAQHPEHTDSLREFFANHDQIKATLSLEEPTLQPSGIGLDEPTIPPAQSSLADATTPPQATSDDPTIPPTGGASRTAEFTVGDQVRYFGDYELLEEIARGGMGVVFKARQKNLNRTVALKMILAGQFAGEEDVQRFYTEAEAAAALDHPGIVPIFEIGEYAGQHYFSMGYVEGDSLAHKVAEGPLPPREAAELVKKICDAMAYAHERGVIHRDLKPANILIDTNGQPKVTDFGLAKKTEADSNLTGTGQILGTPAYMPPEQASGNTNVGPLADVYSLGAILYCLLTGRPPFQAASPMDTLLQVLDQEPVPPRTLNAAIPRDIETICLKCLSKEATRRYDTAEELSGDIQRFISGEPIHARPVGVIERGWRWCKRQPIVAGLSAAFVISLIVGAAVSTYYGVLANRKAAEALAEKSKAERQLYNNLISLAHQELLANNVAQVERLLEDCPEEFRNFEWGYLWHASHSYLVNFDRHTSLVTTIAVSADGQLVATSGADRTIWIWKLNSGKVLHRLVGHTGNVAEVAFSPDSKLLASASWDRTVRIWDVESGSLVHSYPEHLHEVQCVAFSPDGEWIASGSRNTEIHLWQVGTWKRTVPVLRQRGSVNSIDFSPDGKLLASGGSEKTIQLWSVPDGKELRELRGHTHFINDIEFSPNGEVLASSCLNDPVFVWDVEQGTKLKQLGAASVNAQAIQFTGTTVLATSSSDGAIRTWQAGTTSPSEPISTLPAHIGKIHALSYCSDGRRVVSSGEDSTAKVWNLSRMGGSVSVYPTHQAIAFDSQGRRLLRDMSGNSRNSYGAPQKRKTDLTIANIEEPNEVTTIGHFRGPITCIAEGPSNLVAVGLANPRNSGRIIIWRQGEQEPLTDISLTSVPIRMIFSGDGTRLISSHTRRGGQYDVTIFGVTDGKIVHEKGPYRGTANLVDFHDATQQIVAGQVRVGRETKLEIWDARSGNIVRHLDPGGLTRCARFSPDGRQLCTASTSTSGRSTKRSHEIKFWDAATGNLVRTLHGHTDNILAIAYSPDGKRLASKDDDKQLLIWDVASGANLLKLPSSRGSILEFSPDGSRLLSKSSGTTTLYESSGVTSPDSVTSGLEQLVPLEELGRQAMSPPDQVAGFLLGRPHDFWMQGFSKPQIEFERYLSELESTGTDALPFIEKAFDGNSTEIINAMSCLSRLAYKRVDIPPSFLSKIQDQIHHSDPMVRVEAIGYLLLQFDPNNERDSRALDEALKLTAVKDRVVGDRAVRTLSYWIGTGNMAKLEAVLRDPNSPARSGVSRALRLRASTALANRHSPPRFGEDSQILEILTDGARRRDPVLLDTAVTVFAALGPETSDASVEVLSEMLDPSDLDQCFQIVEALQRIGKASHPAVQKLISLASHPNQSMRWEAASALLAIDSDAHRELIAQATSDQPFIENEDGDSLRVTGFDPPLPVTPDTLAKQGLSIECLSTLKSGQRGYLAATPYQGETELSYSFDPVGYIPQGVPTKRTLRFTTKVPESVETVRLTLRVDDQRARPSLNLVVPIKVESSLSEASDERVK